MPSQRTCSCTFAVSAHTYGHRDNTEDVQLVVGSHEGDAEAEDKVADDLGAEHTLLVVVERNVLGASSAVRPRHSASEQAHLVLAVHGTHRRRTRADSDLAEGSSRAGEERHDGEQAGRRRSGGGRGREQRGKNASGPRREICFRSRGRNGKFACSVAVAPRDGQANHATGQSQTRASRTAPLPSAQSLRVAYQASIRANHHSSSDPLITDGRALLRLFPTDVSSQPLVLQSGTDLVRSIPSHVLR